MKFIAFLILAASLAYLAHYFYTNSLTTYTVNEAYRELKNEPCLEVTRALANPLHAGQRTKAEIFLGELARESTLYPAGFQHKAPAQWRLLVEKFGEACQGNLGLPNKEVFMHVDHSAILSEWEAEKARANQPVSAEY